MTQLHQQTELGRLARTAARLLAPYRRNSEIQEARNTLRRKGWSQAEAARQLGVAPGHLCLVLNGHRISHRIIKAISDMPFNPNPA